jgi:pimeloyl-ACP methyl ester carboxylesterase
MKANHGVRMLFASVLLACGTSASAADRAMPDRTPDRTPDSDAEPGMRVEIAGGRHLNLRCEGKGGDAPTIILEAGSNADSTTWFRVQPLLAARTQVCAYDRAGYGFSDEGPQPRSLDADVADLQALLHAAGLRMPVMLVGHSLGSNIVRHYADLHPGDVTGLVLVDPPEQDLAAFMPAAWKADDIAMIAQRDQFLDQCEQAASAGKLAVPAPELQGCLRAPPPWMNERVAAAVAAYKQRPAYWRTLRSELAENAVVFSAAVSPKESHGAMPIIVLAASDTYADAPDDMRKPMEAARKSTHDAIAASSRRGRVQAVADSSHDMQLDQPQAIANAVEALLAEMAISPRE